MGFIICSRLKYRRWFTRCVSALVKGYRACWPFVEGTLHLPYSTWYYRPRHRSGPRGQRSYQVCHWSSPTVGLCPQHTGQPDDPNLHRTCALTSESVSAITVNAEERLVTQHSNRLSVGATVAHRFPVVWSRLFYTEKLAMRKYTLQSARLTWVVFKKLMFFRWV